MVFGGTKIGGASNITRAQATSLPAAEVAGKITENVSAKQAQETLETVAGKLLNGKQLAIHHRTSSKTPRFIRQSQVSHERATHTVAVVRNLFAKAGEQIADSTKQNALKEAVDKYLSAEDTAIQGNQLGILVQQLKDAIAAGKPPQLDGQAPMDQPNLHQRNSEALQVAQPEPEQQAIVPAKPQGPDMPGEPAPQPTNAKIADDLQGLKAAVSGRPVSQKLPKLGGIPVPSIALTSVAGKIEHEAQLSEESGPLLPAESGRISRDIALSEESIEVHDDAEPSQLMDDLIQDSQPEVQSRMSIDSRSIADAQEPVANQDAMQELHSSTEIEGQPYLFGQGQSFEASNRLSGEQLYQRLSGEQDYQVFMGNDDYAEDFGYSRPLSLRGQNFEIDRDFDPEAMNAEPEASEQLDQNQRARLIGQDSSLVQDEDMEIIEDRDVNRDDDLDEDDIEWRPVDARTQEILATLRAQEADAKRDKQWVEFLNQLDAHTDLVAGWQSELGLPTEGDPSPLETRPLGGLAGELRSATKQLRELLDNYMGQTAQQSQLRALAQTVASSSEQLGQGLDQLLESRDTLASAMKPFDGDLAPDSLEQTSYTQGLALAEQIVADADLLIAASQEVLVDPDPREIAERQNRYLDDLLNYPDTELNKSKASVEQLDLQSMSRRQEQLRSFVAVKPFNPQNGPTAFRIREEMKKMGANLNRLQSQLNDVQGELSDASGYIKEDFGTTSEASKRMQAQVDKRLQEVRQLSQQVNASLASIQQDLKLRAVLPPRVAAKSSTPTNPQLAELSKGLLQTKRTDDPTADLDDYENKVTSLLDALSSATALNSIQTEQLKDVLKPQGLIANKFTDLRDILVLKLTNERDSAIQQIMAEHNKRTSEADRRILKAQELRDAIQAKYDARVHTVRQNDDEIKTLRALQSTLGRYVDLQQKMSSLAADEMRQGPLQSQMQRLINDTKINPDLLLLMESNNLQAIQNALDESGQLIEDLQADRQVAIDGGLQPNTDELSADEAQIQTWASAPLDQLENELATQTEEIQNAQTDKLSADKDRDRALANTRGEAERKVKEVTNSVEYRLQELEQAHAQLQAAA